jgi:hypothetical protein
MAIRCARIRMLQSLSGVRLIALQGELERTTKDGSERRSRGLECSLLCADLHSITLGLRSIAITETGTCGTDCET